MNNLIKRIIIGVSIVLIVGFIKSCEVNAKTINTYNFDTVTWPIPNNTHIIDMGFGGWSANKGDGYIIFNFVYHAGGMINSSIRDVWINNMNGQNTECILNPTFMHENGEGSTKPNDYNNILYSVICPVSFTNNNGLNHLFFASTQTQSSSVPQQKIVVSRSLTFVGDDDFGAVLDTLKTDLINTLNDNRGQIRADLGTINNNLNLLITELQQNKNKLQEQINEQKETNQKLEEVQDFLTDTSLPNNNNSDIADLNNNIATNGTISSLVTMPITFLQKIINGLNGTCSPIIIGELYNYNMTMPCINPQQYIGIIWNIIDIICAGFLSYHFGKKLVSIFHNVTSMKDGGLQEAYD